MKRQRPDNQERVSIADAKPIPWRRSLAMRPMSRNYSFQSQTRSQSPGDALPSSVSQAPAASFQSQTRSQSPGDKRLPKYSTQVVSVSIADAKPIPWRRLETSLRLLAIRGFNRRREANPLATRSSFAMCAIVSKFQSQTRSQSPGDVHVGSHYAKHATSFNRRREANPLATTAFRNALSSSSVFQSQTRSQSPGDDGKRKLHIGKGEFQSQTRSQSPGDD